MMEKVRGLDAEIWCLQRPGFVTPHPEGADGASLVFDYLRPDVVDFVAAIHAAFAFDCVVSATEDALLATRHGRLAVGIDGTDPGPPGGARRGCGEVASPRPPALSPQP